MIIVEVIGWIIVVWLTYSIISIGIHIIKQGGDDARDMIGCLAYPLITFAIAIITLGVKQCESEPKTNVAIEQKDKISNEVYICTGRYAKKYHSRPNCRGLNNCRGGIDKVELEKIKGHRSPCSICY